MLAQVWITAATRAALPQNKTGYKKYSNKAITHPNLSLNAATYLGWLFTELGQQTGNIDIQVRTFTLPRVIASLHGTLGAQSASLPPSMRPVIVAGPP